MRERSDSGVGPEAVLMVLIIISVILILFTGTLRDGEGRQIGSRTVLSVQRIFGRASDGIKDGFGSLRKLREMRVQYESALERLSSYQGLERDVVELRNENEALKKLLGFSAGMELEHVPSRIIAGDPSNLFSTLTIDVGTYDGIRVGMVVTAFQDGFFGLIGKVVSVGTRSSQVRPIVDPDNYVASRLQQGRWEGLVEGRGDENGELMMRYVRKTAGSDIGINDLVVTSGMQSIYPPEIYIGRVKEVRSREYSNSLEIILTPTIDITRAEYVFVLENPTQEGEASR